MWEHWVCLWGVRPRGCIDCVSLFVCFSPCVTLVCWGLSRLPARSRSAWCGRRRRSAYSSSTRRMWQRPARSLMPLARRYAITAHQKQGLNEKGREAKAKTVEGGGRFRRKYSQPEGMAAPRYQLPIRCAQQCAQLTLRSYPASVVALCSFPHPTVGQLPGHTARLLLPLRNTHAPAHTHIHMVTCPETSPRQPPRTHSPNACDQTTTSHVLPPFRLLLLLLVSSAPRLLVKSLTDLPQIFLGRSCVFRVLRAIASGISSRHTNTGEEARTSSQTLANRGSSVWGGLC